tara:strand:- start:461 stop:643 length:183 start_codon:yes stop_codon:yes gene_type:complete
LPFHEQELFWAIFNLLVKKHFGIVKRHDRIKHLYKKLGVKFNFILIIVGFIEKKDSFTLL